MNEGATCVDSQLNISVERGGYFGARVAESGKPSGCDGEVCDLQIMAELKGRDRTCKGVV